MDASQPQYSPPPPYPPPMPQAAVPPAAQPAKKPRRTGVRLAIALVIVIIGGGLAFLMLSATSTKHAITQSQWRSIRFGDSEQHMTDTLGKQPAKRATSVFSNRPSSIAIYKNTLHHELAVFQFSEDRLFSKEWSEYNLSKTEMSAADRRVARRMALRGSTQQQFERKFGPPAERADVRGNARFLPLPIRGFYVSSSNTCISYLLASDTSKRVQYCFDAKTHKPLFGPGPPLGLRPPTAP